MNGTTSVERDALRQALLQIRAIVQENERAKRERAGEDAAESEAPRAATPSRSTAPPGSSATSRASRAASPAEEARPEGRSHQEYEEALLAVLERTLPQGSRAHELAKEEPLRAIDQALAYLDLVPAESSPEVEQADFDGHFASLLMRSKLVRSAVVLFFAVILGGSVFLGFETRGAIKNIEVRQDQALASIGRGEATTLAAIERVKTGVESAGNDARTKVASAVTETEDALERKIAKAAEEVVGAQGGEARRTIEAEKNRALRELAALSAPAAKAIADARDARVGELGLAAEKAKVVIEQELNKLLPNLNTDLEKLGAKIDKDSRTLVGLQADLTEAGRIGDAVERLKAQDGVLARVAAILGVAPWVLLFVSATVLLAFILSLTSLLTDLSQPVRKLLAAAAVLIVVGLAFVTGWKTATAFVALDEDQAQTVAEPSDSADDAGQADSPEP